MGRAGSMCLLVKSTTNDRCVAAGCTHPGMVSNSSTTDAAACGPCADGQQLASAEEAIPRTK